jgi:riboflavin kinase/FMN adenylyltransferase
MQAAAAIGTFDGVHRGHQLLIRQLIQTARRKKLRSIIITLERPVRHVPGLLSTAAEKIELLSGFPVDEIVVLPVSREITDLPAEQFLREVLHEKLGVRHLVIGQNFAFGHGRQGDVRWLKKNGPAAGVAVSVVRPLQYRGKIISSSRIRTLLQHGRLRYAARLLGRAYRIEGLPEPGRQIGRQLGFPTINLRVDADKLLPLGVHAALVEGKERLYPAVINIGIRPTFFGEGEVVPEINLLDFKGKWPAKLTRVHLLNHIRGEIKFSGREALKQQIAADREKARQCLCGNK